MEFDVIVKHPNFGIGKISEITFDNTNEPLISVQWGSGRRGCYLVEELEFLVIGE
jgi:hypothetical protein